MDAHWNFVGCDKTTEDELVREWPPFQAELEAKAELLDPDQEKVSGLFFTLGALHSAEKES